MVVPLGPGKFYGSSLPRPRYYTDIKLNDERVDPPVSVLDPLLSWANEAHWSMGGLNFKRLRLQGRIEGNVHKLQAEREKVARKKEREEKKEKKEKQKKKKTNLKRSDFDDDDDDDVVEDDFRFGKMKSVSPPPAPIGMKRRRLLALLDDEDEDEVEEEESGEFKEVVEVVKRRRLVKKLGDDFDRVAAESKRNQSKVFRDREQRWDVNGVGESVMKIVEEINDVNLKGKKMSNEKRGKSVGEIGSVSRTRTSPRLAKRV